ncbi:MAG: hypothetical protein ACYS17_15225 [Planctomycetota bacterium]
MNKNICENVIVPESALLRKERCSRYGSVSGLDDEELADPDELERQVLREELGPVLALPVKGRKNWIQPAVDESGGVDWGAFASVDFSRAMPEFDKARYKADRLQEKVRDLLIMFSIVSERLPGKTKYKVLKYLKMGRIELENIVNWDMWELAKLYLRIRRLREEIADCREASWRRQQGKVGAWLDS